MIDVSSNFRSLAAKIYTFSFLCLVVKLLEPTSISQGGVKIEFTDTSLIVGAFAIVTAFLVLSALLRLLSDFLRTRIADDIPVEEIGSLNAADLVPKNRRTVFAEKHFYVINVTQVASFFIEAIVPVLLGIVVSLYAAQDMVVFLREVTN